MTRFHATTMGVLLVILAAFTTGCENMQGRARAESQARWNRARAEVKLKLASDQLAAGNIADADAELAAAYRLNPDSSALNVMQARIQLAKGDLASAERLLAGASAEEDAGGEIAYLLGVIQEQRLRWPEALECYVRAADADPQEIAYVVAIVQLMLQQGRANDALALLESYEPQFGWTSAYQAALAECCEQLGNWTRAARAWRGVADTVAADADIRERLALAMFRAGHRTEALDYFNRLLEEHPELPRIPLRLAAAKCLLEEGAVFEACERINEVLRTAPRRLEALHLLACAYAQQDQFERAAQTAERALRLAPNDVPTLEIAATMAFRAGRHERAAVLAKRINSVPGDANNPVAQLLLSRLVRAPVEPTSRP